MRIVGNIPNPSMRITVFHMNDKFIVKFEAGPMEQVFKFDQVQHPGLEAIQKLMDAEFISDVHNRFNEMFLAMKSAASRN